ncbi:MAG: F0F1 ATP synthase subunit B [Planctomycetota bacterium]|jgi:F-type H+-transporting ATPase subunit b
MMLDLLAAESSGSPTQINWLPAATTLVVFGIFFFILKASVWPKILKGLDDRQGKIRQEIEGAEEARAQAKSALAEYEENLASARQEARQMIAQAKADANAVAQELRTRNEAELTEMRRRAALEIENAKGTAIRELRAETAVLAAEIAGKILEREISAEDQQRLIDESLSEMASASRS